MNASNDAAIPMACVPGAICNSERTSHFQLLDRVFHQLLQEQTELEDGYAFRFSANELETIATLITNERKCCPFVQFELSIAPGAESLCLRMTGPEGTKEVLRAELALRA